MQKRAAILFLAFFLLLINITGLPQPQKKVSYNDQLWVSFNSTWKFTSKVGMVADVHVRRTNFAADPNFYFLRAGGSYWFNPHFNAIIGYAHMWLANPVEDKFLYTNENRFYQQLQFNDKWKKFNYTVRLRNEHRWQQKISNGIKTNELRYTDRVRMLMGFNYQFFKNPYLPRLLLVNEVAIQFGKEVIYNTFDQNRFIVGVFQKINQHLSFDLSYMLLYQQRYSGYQYDHNNTLRLFFNYTPDFSH